MPPQVRSTCLSQGVHTACARRCCDLLSRPTHSRVGQHLDGDHKFSVRFVWCTCMLHGATCIHTCMVQATVVALLPACRRCPGSPANAFFWPRLQQVEHVDVFVSSCENKQHQLTIARAAHLLQPLQFAAACQQGTCGASSLHCRHIPQSCMLEVRLHDMSKHKAHSRSCRC